MSAPVPTVGRIVHFRLPAGHPNEGAVRPAIVVQAWDGTADSSVNLHVFLDPANDLPLGRSDACSVHYSEEPTPRSWCWPPR